MHDNPKQISRKAKEREEKKTDPQRSIETTGKENREETQEKDTSVDIKKHENTRHQKQNRECRYRDS
jgi:hypothetical protein